MINKLFKSPRLLNKDSDKDIKIAPINNYKFASKLNSITISNNEVGEASKFYPIFFMKSGNEIMPMAVLSLNDDSNNFINSKGNWSKNKYIPSLVRAYPFALSKNGDILNIAIDDSYNGINKESGQKFFDDNGSTSELGSNVTKYLQDLYTSLEQTKAVTKLIDSVGLFKSVDLKVENGKYKFILRGVLQIEQSLLNKLSDENLLKLTKSGSFNLIYAHLNSLSNISNLLK